MSDHDLQDNSEFKQAQINEQEEQEEKEALKNNNLFDSKMQNVVNFDEIPTIKDSKTLVQNNQNPPIEKIDFFGADLNDNNEMQNEYNDDIMSPNDFDQLEKDFVQDDPQSNNNPFGQSITKEILQQSKKEVVADLGD